MDDLFSMFFGGGRQRAGKGEPRKGKPQLKEWKVTLEEVYTGTSVKVPHQKYIICEACEGKGGANVKECQTCHGKGMIDRVVQIGPGMFSHASQPCSECHGRGKSCDEADKCKECHGERVKKVTKVIDVTIEPGVPHEQDVIFTGESDEIVNDVRLREKT
jgi:DnaJ-class molecular chaperone